MELVCNLSRKAAPLLVIHPDLAEHSLTCDSAERRTEIFSGQYSKSLKTLVISLPPLQRLGNPLNHWLFQVPLQFSFEAGLCLNCMVSCSKKFSIQTVDKLYACWRGSVWTLFNGSSASPVSSTVFATSCAASSFSHSFAFSTVSAEVKALSL